MRYFQAVLSISHRKQMVLLKKKLKFEKIFFFSPFVVLLIKICLELVRWSKKQHYLLAYTSCGNFHLLEYMCGYLCVGTYRCTYIYKNENI